MRYVRLGTITATLALGTAAALGAQGAALAAPTGLVDAASKTVKAMVKDIGLVVPARCVVAEQARSDRTWAAYSAKSARNCNPGDGYTVAHRSNGVWKALPIGGSSGTCSDLKAKLADAGAPNAVYRDFRAGKLCVKGE